MIKTSLFFILLSFSVSTLSAQEKSKQEKRTNTETIKKIVYTDENKETFFTYSFDFNKNPFYEASYIVYRTDKHKEINSEILIKLFNAVPSINTQSLENGLDDNFKEMAKELAQTTPVSLILKNQEGKRKVEGEFIGFDAQENISIFRFGISQEKNLTVLLKEEKLTDIQLEVNKKPIDAFLVDKGNHKEIDRLFSLAGDKLLKDSSQ